MNAIASCNIIMLIIPSIFLDGSFTNAYESLVSGIF